MAGFDATSVETTSTKLSTAQALPDVPADGPLLHDAQNFREKFDDTLAAHDLLAVARGEEPPAATAIVDYPMDTLPYRLHLRRPTPRRCMRASNAP